MKSIFNKGSIAFFGGSALIFADLFFFRAANLKISGMPRITWEIVLSLFLGFIFFLIVSTNWFSRTIKRVSRRWLLIALLLSVVISALLMVVSRTELTENRLTALRFEISAVEGDLRMVYVDDVLFDHKPLVWKTQCQFQGNVKWDGDNPILESNPPVGSIGCTVYPGMVGVLDASQFEVFLKRQPQSAQAVITVNGVASRVNAEMLSGQGGLDRIQRDIPYTPGILLVKAIEFLSYLVVTFFMLILGPFSVRHRLRVIKSQFSREDSWRSLTIITFGCIFTFILFEWIFVVTKPSFLSAVSLPSKIETLLVTIACFSAVTFVFILVLFLIGSVPALRPIRKSLKKVAAILPAFFFSALVFLLIDNFTYTLFNRGIATSEGYQRGLYLLLVIFLFLQIYPRVGNFIHDLDKNLKGRPANRFLVSILVVLIGVTLILAHSRQIAAVQSEVAFTSAQKRKLPDIILITADGLNATQTSLYGDEPDTTPHIRALARTSLVAENAFANAGNTAGSVISIYTGKYPFQTRLLYPPDILRGVDSYQHLPGILKSMGYYTAEFAAPRNADAYDLNLISGFDLANGRSIQNNLLFSQLNQLFPSNDAYLVYEILNRVFNRLGHMMFLSTMSNDLAFVEGEAQEFDDESKIKGLLAVLDKNQRPVFAHLHWMGTHAGRYTPVEETDAHINDDNIRKFDAGVGEIIETLTKNSAMDNTLLIVGSDHGRMYFTTKRIPLLFHFPQGEYASKITSDVQNLDIAPTILDYLDIKKPAWMQGESLLSGEPGGELGSRLIFGAGVPTEIRNTGFVSSDYMKPPFYQFGYISVVSCDSWYRFSFEDYQMTAGPVQGHTHACPAGERIPDQEIFERMKAHLSANGFDVSSLEWEIGDDDLFGN